VALKRHHATLWPIRCGLFILLVILVGCRGVVPSPEIEMSAEAGRLLSVIARLNAEVTSIKGIGKLSLRSGPTPGNFRFAWAAMPPDRLRIELMDPTGRPAGTLARDGRWTYLRNHQDGRLFRRRSLDRQLRKWIGVPVEIADLIALVSGGVPVRDHDAVDVIRDINGNPTLVLRRRQTVVERIQMTPDGESVAKIELFNASGQVAFFIDFAERAGGPPGRLPPWVAISSPRGDFVKIEFLRYRENIPLDPSMFVLEDARRATSSTEGLPRYVYRHPPAPVDPWTRRPLVDTPGPTASGPKPWKTLQRREATC